MVFNQINDLILFVALCSTVTINCLSNYLHDFQTFLWYKNIIIIWFPTIVILYKICLVGNTLCIDILPQKENDNISFKNTFFEPTLVSQRERVNNFE